MAVVAQRFNALRSLVYQSTHSTDHDDTRPPIDCKLAACYGNLKDHLSDMDNYMISAIGITVATLRELDEDRTWNNVMSAMMNNPAIEPSDLSDDIICRYPPDLNFKSWNLSLSGYNQVTETSPEVQDVEKWIKNLIGDDDVIADLSFNPQDYALFVKRTGAAVENMLTAIYREEKRYRTVIDVGVLRYPKISNPCFKVYRLSLQAYVESCRVMSIMSFNDAGISGQFHCRKFKVRKEFVEKISKESMEKAHEVVKNLLK